MSDWKKIQEATRKAIDPSGALAWRELMQRSTKPGKGGLPNEKPDDKLVALCLRLKIPIERYYNNKVYRREDKKKNPYVVHIVKSQEGYYKEQFKFNFQKATNPNPFSVYGTHGNGIEWDIHAPIGSKLTILPGRGVQGEAVFITRVGSLSHGGIFLRVGFFFNSANVKKEQVPLCPDMLPRVPDNEMRAEIKKWDEGDWKMIEFRHLYGMPTGFKKIKESANAKNAALVVPTGMLLATHGWTGQWWRAEKPKVIDVTEHIHIRIFDNSNKKSKRKLPSWVIEALFPDKSKAQLG